MLRSIHIVYNIVLIVYLAGICITMQIDYMRQAHARVVKIVFKNM